MSFDKVSTGGQTEYVHKAALDVPCPAFWKRALRFRVGPNTNLRVAGEPTPGGPPAGRRWPDSPPESH